jgi:hypothetical protein
VFFNEIIIEIFLSIGWHGVGNWVGRLAYQGMKDQINA